MLNEYSRRDPPLVSWPEDGGEAHSPVLFIYTSHSRSSLSDSLLLLIFTNLYKPSYGCDLIKLNHEYIFDLFLTEQKSPQSHQMTDSSAVTLLFYVNKSGDSKTSKTYAKISASRTLLTLLKQVNIFWIFLLLFSGDRILLWIPYWSQMHHSPISASQVSWLQVCATTLSPLKFWFCFQHNGFNHSRFLRFNLYY